MPAMNIEAINADWLSDQLGRPVNAIQLEPLSTTSGYLADVYRINLAGTDLPSSLVLKMEAATPERRDIAIRYQSYQKEYVFYDRHADDVPVRVPTCFNRQSSPGFFLLLEDLKDWQDINPLTGVSPAQVSLAMAALARLHGCPTGSEMPQFQSGFMAAAAELPALASGVFYTSIDPAPAGQVLETYLNKPGHSLGLFKQQEQVFCHGDFRLSNLRFSESELAVFDWGEWCVAPRGMDLAGFLVFSLPVPHRRALEQQALEEYAACSPAPVDIDALFDSYRLSLLPAVYLPALMLTTGQEPELARCFQERLQAAITDHADWLQQVLS